MVMVTVLVSSEAGYMLFAVHFKFASASALSLSSVARIVDTKDSTARPEAISERAQATSSSTKCSIRAFHSFLALEPGPGCPIGEILHCIILTAKSPKIHNFY
jgi:hypothetical protein